ncbi:MAG: hypothetical protein WCK85_04515 [Chlorobium sp.]
MKQLSSGKPDRGITFFPQYRFLKSLVVKLHKNATRANGQHKGAPKSSGSQSSQKGQITEKGSPAKIKGGKAIA